MNIYAVKDRFGTKDCRFASENLDNVFTVLSGKENPKNLIFVSFAPFGPKTHSIMPVGAPSCYLLSDQAYQIMKKEGLTGWYGLPVKVFRKRPLRELEDGPYYFLQIPSRVGPARYANEVVEVNGASYTKGIITEMKSYDGSDIFVLSPLGEVCVTQKWKDVFEKHFSKLFTFTPIEEYLSIVI